MSKKNSPLKTNTKANKKGNTKHNPDERARDNVKATDSWLIYLFQDVGKAFRWSKNEIDLVVDSTRCAFDTTKKITNRMIMRPKQNHNLSSSEEALLQELDFEVSECPDGDYPSMGHDVELLQFATLHSLGRKVGSKATGPPENRSGPVTKEEPPREVESEQEGSPYPAPDPGVLEKEHSPQGKIEAIKLADDEDEARLSLERGLRDSNAKVKRRALSHLSFHDSPWALLEIRRLCNDPEPGVRWAALEALLTVRPSEACDNLELMMPSLDPACLRRTITLLERRKSLLNNNSTDQTPSAPEVRVSSIPDVGEKAKEIKECAPKNKAPKESESSPPRVKTESDID